MSIERRLSEYLDSIDAPFVWRKRNCVHFSARWVEIAENRTLYVPEDLRGQVSLLHSASTAEEAVSKVLGRSPLQSARLAQVGDLLMFRGKRYKRFRLGICVGLRVATLVQGYTGVVYESSTGASCAWRVEIQ